jgi:hypothetical protein
MKWKGKEKNNIIKLKIYSFNFVFQIKTKGKKQINNIINSKRKRESEKFKINFDPI